MDNLDGGSESQSNDPKTKIDVCPICFGTGTWLKPDKGPILCPCRHSSLDRRIEIARIPLRFRECTLANYKPKNVSQWEAHTFARKLVDDYPGVSRGLLLMGGVGVGKTHLAIGIVRALVEMKGAPCLFYESGSLLKTIQDSYNSISQTSEMRVLSPVYEAEVLVLDELGATVPTDWVRDTMYQIINKRYNDRKLTIFTTNFPDEVRIERNETQASTYVEEFSDRAIVESQQYRTGKPASRRHEQIKNTTLEERIGTRLRSRLYEMCKQVLIEGEDYRKRTDGRRFDADQS